MHFVIAGHGWRSGLPNDPQSSFQACTYMGQTLAGWTRMKGGCLNWPVITTQINQRRRPEEKQQSCQTRVMNLSILSSSGGVPTSEDISPLETLLAYSSHKMLPSSQIIHYEIHTVLDVELPVSLRSLRRNPFGILLLVSRQRFPT